MCLRCEPKVTAHILQAVESGWGLNWRFGGKHLACCYRDSYHNDLRQDEWVLLFHGFRKIFSCRRVGL